MNKIAYNFFAAILLLTFSISAVAQPGTWDQTFGTGGFVTTDIGGLQDKCYSILIQSDDKIVVAGYSMNSSNNTDFSLARYTSNGALDVTFDTDGKTVLDFANSNDYAYSAAMQDDGKFVLAGFMYNVSDPDFAVARFNADGSPDNSFGTGGKVTTAFGSNADYAESVAIQSDGKIVVAGRTATPGNPNLFALVRYNSNGTLDNTFDTDGAVTTAFGTSSGEPRSVAIQSDGKILVGGSISIPPDNVRHYMLVRYNSDGSIDNTFDTDGIVTTSIGGANDLGQSVLLQPDGKIILGGYDAVVNGFVLVRYNSNGSVDNTFGTAGSGISDFGTFYSYAYAAALQDDGKIILAGNSNISTLDFVLMRYNSDGTLDNTFGVDGESVLDFGGSNDEGMAVGIQSDGKIVMAGTYWDAPNTDDNFSLARFNGDPVGIEESTAEENTVTVFPNPFSNELTIKGLTGKGELAISDVAGNECLHVLTGNNAELKITTSFLSPGFYMLNYTSGTKTVNTKLVKF